MGCFQTYLDTIHKSKTQKRLHLVFLERDNLKSGNYHQKCVFVYVTLGREKREYDVLCLL